MRAWWNSLLVVFEHGEQYGLGAVPPGRTQPPAEEAFGLGLAGCCRVA